MKKREPVSHIMTKDVISMDVYNGTLEEAKKTMEDKHIRHIPIVKGQELVGMLSLTDIYRISYGGNFNQEKDVDSVIFSSMSIAQVMKGKPKTVTAQTPIKEVAEQLAVEEFHALPVVDEKGGIEGIVTTTDLVKFLIKQY